MGFPKFSEDERTTALTVLAFSDGNILQAVRRLKEDHAFSISVDALRRWRDKDYADRYEEIRIQVDRILADQSKSLAFDYAETERELNRKLREEMDNLQARDIHTAIRNVATAPARIEVRLWQHSDVALAAVKIAGFTVPQD